MDETIEIDNRLYNTFCNSRQLEFKFPSITTRLEDIIRTGQSDIVIKINNLSHVQWRDGEIVVSAPPRRHQEHLADWTTMKSILDKISKLISYYEMKEATSTFELALWKAKLDKQEAHLSTLSYGTFMELRSSYRIEVPGPVKENILKYIYPSTEGI